MDSRLAESAASLDVDSSQVLFQPPASDSQAPRACAKMSPCAKSCMICSIICVVVAAIMAPIGIFVIGPSIAQHILDTTDISMPNATLNPCDTLAVWANIHAIFEASTMGLSATLNPYNQSLSTTTCLDESQDPPAMNGGWNCNNATKTLVGTYESPTLELSSGKNHVNLSIGVKLNSLNVLFNGIVVPAFIDSKKVRLILEAKDISIQVLGITLSGLTMNKVVTCSQGTVDGGQGKGQTADVNIPNSVCHPDKPNSTLDDNPGYTMICVSGDTEPLNTATTITTTITTTTVAPTTAAAATKSIVV